MFNKDLEEIKKIQSIMNNAITEIKNTLEGAKGTLEGTESEDKFKRQMSRVAQIQPWDSVSVTGSRQRKRAYRR